MAASAPGHGGWPADARGGPAGPDPGRRVRRRPAPVDGASRAPAGSAPAGPVADERWPDAAAVLLTALGPGPWLWERGPEHLDALTVRLGTAERDGGRSAAPVSVELRRAGALGWPGRAGGSSGWPGPPPPSWSRCTPRDAGGRAGQHRSGAHPGGAGGRLVLAGLAAARPPDPRPGLPAAARLRQGAGRGPYRRVGATAGRRPPGPRLAQRRARRGGLRRRPPPGAVHPADRGRRPRLVRAARDHRTARGGRRCGRHPRALPGRDLGRLPAFPLAATYEAARVASPAFGECGAVAVLSGDVATALRVVQPGSGPNGTVATVDAVSVAWAERFARALAPLREVEAGGGPGPAAPRAAIPLPESARLLDELGLARATPRP
ncbi:hypothetical protein O1L44_21255 [Streptomyces noursei]|nr:hypothetical protein [Streptomyces noursei]